jgi:hypothetical protein
MIRHFGTVTQTGEIVAMWAKGRKVLGPSPRPPEQLQIALKSMPEPIGLPGSPRPHKVVGNIDGHKIRAEWVQMVWNDWRTIDTHHGEGTYERFANQQELEVLQLAKQLYGSAILDSAGSGK